MSKLLALIAVLSAGPALAADLKHFDGVWEGRLGKLPIRACYSGDANRSEGKYFYSRHLSTIPLIADENAPGDLAEGRPEAKDAARWRLTKISLNRAEGTWSGNGRSLPIHLTRVKLRADDEFDTPCSNLAFLGPVFRCCAPFEVASAAAGRCGREMALRPP